MSSGRALLGWSIKGGRASRRRYAVAGEGPTSAGPGAARGTAVRILEPFSRRWSVSSTWRARFARRQQDLPRPFFPGEALDHRQGEREVCTRTGLGDADEVLALDGDRDGLGLDGRRLVEAGVGQAVEDIRKKTEAIKPWAAEVV